MSDLIFIGTNRVCNP